jgi:CO dehydrogenase maturation factor
MKISVCGRGGSGKSTLVTLLARSAQLKSLKVLVVDSDESNSGLFRMLGFDKPPVPLMELVGGKKEVQLKLREALSSDESESGMSILTQDTLIMDDIPAKYISGKDGLRLACIGKIHQSLEGCACPMGVLSREFLKKLILKEDEIAIVDLEAGVEHFGRGVETSIDHVLVVVEPSFESLDLAERLKSLTGGIKKNLWAVLNKIDSERLSSRLESKLKNRDIQVIGTIPYDSTIFEACLEGRAIKPDKATHAARKILDFLVSKRQRVNPER